MLASKARSTIRIPTHREADGVIRWADNVAYATYLATR